MSRNAPQRVPNEVRRARTREAILDAAEQQIVRRGFAATAVDAVAPEAGVSKGAVYFHFGTKDDLLDALLERSQTTVFAPALALLSDSKQPSPRSRLVAYFNHVGANHHIPRYLLPVIVSVQGEGLSAQTAQRLNDLTNRIRTALTTVMEEGQRAGEFTGEQRPEEQAALTMALMDGMLLQWHRHGAQLEGSAFLRTGRRALLGALEPRDLPGPPTALATR